MPKSIIRLLNVIGHWQTLHGLWVFFVPTTITTALTAYGAYMQSVPLYLIIYYSAGVFCFMSLIFCAIYAFYNSWTINGKIRFQNYKVIQAVLNPGTQTVNINSGGAIYNNSSQDVYIQITGVAYSLKGRTSLEPFKKPAIFIAHAKTEATMLLHTISDIPVGNIEGNARFEFAYGRTKDNLEFKYMIEGKPIISLVTSPDSQMLLGHMSDMTIVDIDYGKV